MSVRDEPVFLLLILKAVTSTRNTNLPPSFEVYHRGKIPAVVPGRINAKTMTCRISEIVKRKKQQHPKTEKFHIDHATEPIGSPSRICPS